jgi:hypothetical protein
MSRIDQLLTSFRRHVALPLRPGLPLSQRVWFVVYPPEDERRLGPRLSEFELATKDAGLNWSRVDVSGSFAGWLDSRDDKDEIVGDPELVESYADPDYADWLKSKVAESIADIPADQAEKTVLAMTGLMELYDFIHVSDLIDTLDKSFTGVLLVLFPGERDVNTYRFLEARDGWDYLAVPILPESQL